MERGNRDGRLGTGGCGLRPGVIPLGVAFVALFTLTVSGDAPHVYAITGARIVPAVGSPIESGTVVIRRGLIEDVGSAVRPPTDARIIDAKGMTVYPGLIDLSNRAAVEAVASPAPQNPRSTEEVERWKRALLLQPHFMAATRVRVDTPDLTRLAAAGITAALASPPGEVFKGQSALVTVVAPDDEPQIGALADERRGRIVVRTPVAMHLAVPARPRGNAYPNSLMGTIAFIRQSLLDAQHYVAVHARYQRGGAGAERPIYDAALEALQPALARRVPVVVEADQEREIKRALDLAREFGFDPIVDGGHEAGKAIDALKQSKAPVIYSLNFPTRPRTLAPDADEPIQVLRLRANVLKVPAELRQAQVPFAFGSSGLREPRDFLANAAKAVKAGLAADAALAALTIEAARIAGVADRMGSIEKGKFANVIVTDGDLFGEKTRIVHVFVDGRLVAIDPTPPGGGNTETR